MERGGRLFLRLFGGVDAGRNEACAPPIRFSTRKVGGLLAILALSQDRPVSRERLAHLLWGSSSDQQARQSLRQALLFLRRDVQPLDIVEADAQSAILRPGKVWVDALEAERLASSNDYSSLARAAQLLRGPFLDQVAIHEEAFEDWVREQRRRFETVEAAVLERLAAAASALGRGTDAVAAAERLLAINPLREDRQRLVLTVYARHRGRHEALAKADGFANLMRRDLGVALEEETQRLVEDIRQGSFTAAPPAPWPGEEVGQADLSEVAPAPRGPARMWPALWRRPAVRVGVAVAAVAMIAGGLHLAVPLRPEPGDLPVLYEAIGPAGPDGGHSKRRTAPAFAGGRFEDGLIVMAVIPFSASVLDVEGEDRRQADAFADLITDELTTTLYTANDMRVISRESMRILRGEHQDAMQLGARFGVHYVLEGKITMRGRSVRANVGLVDARTGLRVWAQRFERDAQERYALLDQIVSALCRELQVAVTRIASETGSHAVDVHATILRGWSKIHAAGREGRPALEQAKASFTEALHRDPANVRAQLGLAAYHVNMAVQLFAADPAPHLDEAEGLLESLIKRRPGVATAHSYLGLAHFMRGRSAEAKRAFERAIEFSPSHAPSHAQLGRILLRLGRNEEALERIQYAIRLSPRDPLLNYWLGFAGAAELELGRVAAAVSTLTRAVELNPRQPRNVLALAAAHALSGNLAEARRRLEELQRSLPHLSGEALAARFGPPSRGSQIQRGLRLATGQLAEAPLP